jgi:hypothetical protein
MKSTTKTEISSAIVPNQRVAPKIGPKAKADLKVDLSTIFTNISKYRSVSKG